MSAAAMSKTKSREYLELIKSIGECKSKLEEDAIMKQEIEFLKKKLADPKIEKAKLREYVVRLVYVELLGHDASFGHIHAVKLCSDANLLNKKVAYLATTLFLNDRSELLILLMNTMKSDLHSDNFLIVSSALTTVCHLVAEDAIPLLLPSIQELIKHPKELVRKKAIMALHRCFIKAPHLVEGYSNLCRKALCDSDPSVMGAALCALHDAMKADPLPYKNLVKSLLHVLTQVIDRRLPKSYDNHRLPAPFIQIKLLKMLAILGNGDKNASAEMHPVILSALRSANSGTSMGNALVYECVRTATTIHPNSQLLTASAGMIAHFLQQNDNNLKYVALDALGHIVQINASYGTEHQMSVIDCLEDPDETLKKKTLELLYRMTKTDNVEIVVDKMLSFLESASDEHIRADVATRIGELAERYAPDNQWFIETMNKVFELAGDLIKPDLGHDLMQLIAEGTGDGHDADVELRTSAVSSYIDLLAKPKLPTLLLEVMSWVLGEYGTLSLSPEELMASLIQLGKRQDITDSVRGYVLSAICKACCQSSTQPSPEVERVVSNLLVSRNLDLQQRAIEVQAILSCPADLQKYVCPHDASCEDVQIRDEAGNSDVIDQFVNEALANGATPYISAMAASSATIEQREEKTMRYEAYETPTERFQERPDFLYKPQPAQSAVQPLENLLQEKPNPGQPTLNISGPRKWGRPSVSEPPKPAESQETLGGASSGNFTSDSDFGVGSGVSLTDDFGLGGGEPTPVVETTSYEPREMSDKQKLAASLFGGSSSRSKNARAPKQVETPIQEPTLLTEVNQPQAPPNIMDQLSLIDMGAPTAAPTPIVPTPAAPTPSVFDLIPQVPPQASTAMRPKMGKLPEKPKDNDPFKDLLG